MSEMWGVFTVETMKTLIENPQGYLVAGCTIFFLALIGVTLALLILSSLGVNIGNISFWSTAFFSELSFMIGLLTGGNLREKHN